MLQEILKEVCQEKGKWYQMEYGSTQTDVENQKWQVYASYVQSLRKIIV